MLQSVEWKSWYDLFSLCMQSWRWGLHLFWLLSWWQCWWSHYRGSSLVQLHWEWRALWFQCTKWNLCSSTTTTQTISITRFVKPILILPLHMTNKVVWLWFFFIPHSVSVILFWGFPTRMVYLDYMLCLRYTILVGNPCWPRRLW